MKLIILPIEVSDANKLRAVYCQEDTCPIEVSVDHLIDTSIFSSISRNLAELGQDQIDHSKIFKLGKIDGAQCYAVDVTGSKSGIPLTRVSFHKLMEGDYSNSKLLAASFLAISYFA